MLSVVLGLGGIHIEGQLTLRKNKIKLCEDLLIFCKFLGMQSTLHAQIRQYLFDLFLLIQHEFPDLVVQFHNGGGLDEESGTRGGLVVDHTGNHGFILSLHGNTVSVVPHGDDGILKICLEGAVYHVTKLAVNLVTGLSDLASDGFKSAACIICDLILSGDTAVYLVCQLCERMKIFKVFIQRICG